jgi:hypothetical protein
MKFLETAIPTATPTPAPDLEKATDPDPTPTEASMIDSLDARISTLPTGVVGVPTTLFSMVALTRVETVLVAAEDPPDTAIAVEPIETATLAA